MSGLKRQKNLKENIGVNVSDPELGNDLKNMHKQHCTAKEYKQVYQQFVAKDTAKKVSRQPIL